MFFFLGGSSGVDLSQANGQAVEAVSGALRSGIGNILNVLRIAGSGIALIMLAYMSISYFSANGSMHIFGVQKQADVKGRQLINFAIGVAIFIGASNILYFIVKFVGDVAGDF